MKLVEKDNRFEIIISALSRVASRQNGFRDEDYNFTHFVKMAKLLLFSQLPLLTLTLLKYMLVLIM